MVVRRVAVSSPEQIIQRPEGQTSRWYLLSGRYSLTLLPQFHSRGRFLLIPALWVFKETARWERNKVLCQKLYLYNNSSDSLL